MRTINDVPMSITALKECYQRGEATPRSLILDVLRHARQGQEQEQNPVWLHLLSEAELEPYLSRLEAKNTRGDDLPLYGIPFAIKDNIDLAGVPTTAACPQFSYVPQHSAFVIELLVAAGAIPLGKTNLDQFATGLVGVRSPYGACKNALNPEFISGGSSSGSAVAVAKQWAAFALGTDTAGSGRVPAALNNLVGLKPTRGLFSTRGLVPACRSLDCISLFAHSVADVDQVFNVIAHFDAEDPYARLNPYNNGQRYDIYSSSPTVIGVPRASQMAFFGDGESEALFAAAIKAAQDAGAQIREVDFQPFLEAAALLYDGPWVAERYIAIQSLIEQSPQALLPVTREIIAAGKAHSAIDAFKSQYRLKACEQKAKAIVNDVDCIMTPTIGTDYTIAEVEADPIRLNSNLGYYTNFMNLLDCFAIAIPAGFKSSGVGFGVTLFHQAFSDKRLMAYANWLSQKLQLPADKKANIDDKFDQRPIDSQMVDMIVCGAHMDGLALNWQLRERHARLINVTTTAPNYRFYALAGDSIARPGLIRDEQNGGVIEVEVWRVPTESLGSFVADIPAPLALGKVELADGSWRTGFVCETYVVKDAAEITDLGSWRTYLERLKC